MDDATTKKTPAPRKKKPKVVIDGDLVETLRKANRWSQAELGTRCYMTQAMVSHVEKGGATPGVDTCFFLANAFGVPMEKLVTIAQAEET